MLKMGISALAPQPGTSQRNSQHQVSVPVTQTGDSAQQTGVDTAGHNLHPHGAWLCVFDSGGGCVLSPHSGTRTAITLEACHAVEALEEAYSRFGNPEVVNTDQGSQFTAQSFVDAVLDHGVKLSIDGRGARRDNVFVNESGEQSSTSGFIYGPMTA